MLWRLIISGLMCPLFVTVWAVAYSQPADKVITVGAFSRGKPGEKLPDDWELLTFPGIEKRTQYRLVQDRDMVSVQAHSRASASGMIRNLKFDSQQYPWLAWRWKIERILDRGDFRTKQGDDYAARVYVAFEFQAQKANWWQRMTHAVASRSAGRELPGTMLTYIWANQARVGEVLNNAYADQAKMVVLQSGNAKAGQWMDQRRNIFEDYVRAFGQEPPPAMGVAIMTDTDGTGETTSAYYGDIILSRER